MVLLRQPYVLSFSITLLTVSLLETQHYSRTHSKTHFNNDESMYNLIIKNCHDGSGLWQWKKLSWLKLFFFHAITVDIVFLSITLYNELLVKKNIVKWYCKAAPIISVYSIFELYFEMQKCCINCEFSNNCYSIKTSGILQ